jgi:hypothetical protein
MEKHVIRSYVEEFIGIFTNEGFQVVAGHIVPSESIIVEVVQDRQTRFVIALEEIMTRCWVRFAKLKS